MVLSEPTFNSRTQFDSKEQTFSRKVTYANTSLDPVISAGGRKSSFVSSLKVTAVMELFSHTAKANEVSRKSTKGQRACLTD